MVTAHTYDGHPLADVVEVQYGEQGVRDGPSQLNCGYSPGCPGAKHKAEVSSRRHQSTLVWRLSLVKQLPWWDNKDGASAGIPAPLLAPSTTPPHPPAPPTHPHSSPRS